MGPKLALATLPFIAGIGLIVQSGINASLMDSIGHGILAACVSFAGGTLLLFLLYVAQRASEKRKKWATSPVPSRSSADERSEDPPAAPRTPRSGRPGLRLWHLIGGVIGAVFVTILTIVSPLIGFAVVFVTLVLGQLTTSLVFDHVGFAGMPRRPFSKLKAVGAATLLVGAFLTVVQLLVNNDADVGTGTAAVLALLCAFSGTAAPLQTVINSKVGAAIRSPLGAALLSFAVGTLVLLLASIVVCLIDQGVWSGLGDGFQAARWWEYSGGAPGAVYVYLALKLAPTVGIATFFVSLIAGQLSASLVLDHIGAFGFDKRSASALRVAGVLTAFIGVAIIQYARKHDAGLARASSFKGASGKLSGPASTVVEMPVKDKTDAMAPGGGERPRNDDTSDEEKGET
eukprot:CAMPEP_0196772238 /NCGR_PEP_ID=MMETSP1104-20130614/2122_1 /TAXON_ID=33652 /ORGANISM="Cafeteria sp., Strain Caron Lab Isolate" /LENGTH=401 /DNA_ID=CAMNT_0042142371 /DNA_START=24 /DNA_END=1229 /DNA_ORIENTATION=+